MTGDGTMELLHKIYIQYLFFGPMFVIVLAAAKSISKQKLTINYIYSLSYLFMGLGMLQILSYSTKCYPGYWYVSYFMIPVSFGSPVMLYLRFRFLIQNRRVRWPAPLTIGLVAVFLFLLAGALPVSGVAFTRENIELRPLLDPSFQTLPLYFKAVHILNFIAKLILAAGLASLLMNARHLWREKGSPEMMLARTSYVFTILMFSTAVMLVGGDIFGFALTRAAIAMVNTVTLGVFLASQYDTSYYGIFKHLKRKKKYAVSKVRGIDVGSIIAGLDRIMTERELYKEEDMSLKTVAEMMNVNLQQLSEILNKDIKKSFRTYINDFKMDEAKRLLASEPDMTITRIAFTVGFNSVRSFNRVFANSEGCTPLEYRKRASRGE